jgi:hypothetical protein
MSKLFRSRRFFIAVAVSGAIASLAGCSGMGGGSSSGSMMSGHVSLSGASEVPANSTSASGMGMVTIKEDRSVSAKITVTGMVATAAHIHEAAAGENGPVIVPLTKKGDDTFVAADGAKLTESQYASYKAGKLYVNVHSARSPAGEIRAQLSGK